MKWTRVWIPRSIADLVDPTAGRAGVPKESAIAAALWFYGRHLTLQEKESVIKLYLLEDGISLEVKLSEELQTKRRCISVVIWILFAMLACLFLGVVVGWFLHREIVCEMLF